MQTVEIAEILTDVKTRLTAYGIALKDTDDVLLKYSGQMVRETITNNCNQPEIPAGLRCIAADMIIGDFLQTLKVFSPDRLESFDLGEVVKQIQTGDTNTVFAVGEGSSTDEQRLDAVVNWLLNHGKGQFAKYRRVCWW